tara:strand:- start:3899 stop:4027 length:129 start_codon:yes stop_codon:yes gene_type:complete
MHRRKVQQAITNMADVLEDVVVALQVTVNTALERIVDVAKLL